MKIAEYNCFLVQATFALCQTNVYKRVRSTNKMSLEKHKEFEMSILLLIVAILVEQR